MARTSSSARLAPGQAQEDQAVQHQGGVITLTARALLAPVLEGLVDLQVELGPAAGPVAAARLGQSLQGPQAASLLQDPQHPLAHAAGVPGGEAPDPPQLIRPGGRPLGEVQERRAVQHAEGRLIALPGQLVAQDEEAAQALELDRGELAGALDADELVGVEVRLHGGELLQSTALALDDHGAPQLLELRLLIAHQSDQEVRVQARVVHLLRAQRPLAPVGALHRLVQLDAEALVQDAGQPGVLDPQRRRRHARVEQRREPEAVVPLEDQDVVLPVVEDLDPLRIGEHLPQGADVDLRQRIEQVVDPSRGELDQADLLAVVEEGVRLGVDRDLALPLQRLQQSLQAQLVLDQGRGGQIGGHAWRWGGWGKGPRPA